MVDTRMAVVVVSFNTLADLRDCLATVEANHPPEVVVVDNGSSDGSADMVRAEYPGVQVVANTENVGYGSAANQGVARCSCRYVLMLNSDTRLPEGALHALGTYLDREPRVGVVGPRLIGVDGRAQASAFPPLSAASVLALESGLGRLALQLAPRLRVASHAGSTREPGWVLGAALAVRRRAFAAVGGFDESFFMYCEEIDLCQRLQGAGWEVHFAPVTTIVHTGEASVRQHPAEMLVQLYKSRMQFSRKYHSPWQQRLLAAAITYLMVRNIVIGILSERIRLCRGGSAVTRRNSHAWRAVLASLWLRASPNENPPGSRWPVIGGGFEARIPGLLELMHPDGVAASCRLLGQGQGLGLQSDHLVADRGPADLTIIAPGAQESARQSDLSSMVETAIRGLAPDGVIYVLAPPRVRRRVRHLFQRHGLSIGPAMRHVPGLAVIRCLVPLDPGPAEYALSRLLLMPFWRRALVLGALKVWGGPRLLGDLVPRTGLLAHRSGARPPLAWAFQLCGADQPGTAVICTGWRGRHGATLLHLFSAGDALPFAIAKVTRNPEPFAGRPSEGELLTVLGPGAAAAGARVPCVIAHRSLGKSSVLLETVVKGDPASYWLRRGSDRAPALMNRVAEWLGRWSQTSAVRRPVDLRRVEAELVVPAQLLASDLEHGTEYVEWLGSQSAYLVGSAVAFVATHNDLTMSNVLLDGSGRLGIIDWEMGQEDGLPLVDFLYAAVDAATWVRKDHDRVAAFKECFAPGGWLRPSVAHLEARLARASGVQAAWAELCFHACWLHHAANERRSSDRTASRPFLAIVQGLVLDHHVSAASGACATC